MDSFYLPFSCYLQVSLTPWSFLRSPYNSYSAQRHLSQNTTNLFAPAWGSWFISFKKKINKEIKAALFLLAEFAPYLQTCPPHLHSRSRCYGWSGSLLITQEWLSHQGSIPHPRCVREPGFQSCRFSGKRVVHGRRGELVRQVCINAPA